MLHETLDPPPGVERRSADLSSRRSGVPPLARASLAAIGMLVCLIAGSRSDAAMLAYVAGLDSVFSLDVSNSADSGSPLVTSGVLEGAGGLSIDSAGNLLVSSIFNDIIPRYDSAGTLINLFSDANALDAPSRSLIGPNGNLFVLSGQFDSNGADTILQLNSSTGRVVNSIDIKSLNGGAYDATGAMTIGPDGKLYVGVLDHGSGSILRFNPQTGKFLDVFISQGVFPLPQTMTFGPFGLLYVASRNFEGVGEIQRFSAGTGKDLGTISNVDLNTMAFGPDGKLYGLTPDGHLDRLKVDANGATLRRLAARVSSLNETIAEQMKFAPNTVPGQQTALDVAFGGLEFSKDLILHFQVVQAVGVTSPVGVDPATLRGLAGVTLFGAFDLSSSALFDGPITLDFQFDPAMLPAGFTEAELRLFAYDPLTGLRDITSFVNFDGQFVEANADTLGTFAIGAVPEPSSLALCGLGSVALAGYARRRRKRRAPEAESPRPIGRAWSTSGDGSTARASGRSTSPTAACSTEPRIGARAEAFLARVFRDRDGIGHGTPDMMPKRIIPPSLARNRRRRRAKRARLPFRTGSGGRVQAGVPPMPGISGRRAATQGPAQKTYGATMRGAGRSPGSRSGRSSSSHPSPCSWGSPAGAARQGPPPRPACP